MIINFTRGIYQSASAVVRAKMPGHMNDFISIRHMTIHTHPLCDLASFNSSSSSSIFSRSFVRSLSAVSRSPMTSDNILFQRCGDLKLKSNCHFIHKLLASGPHRRHTRIWQRTLQEVIKRRSTQRFFAERFHKLPYYQCSV